MRKTIARLIALLVTLGVVAGCGGETKNTAEQSAAEPPPSTTTAPAANTSSKGVGPITEVVLGPIDEVTVAKGKAVFDSKCAVCHKIEERYVGPAIRGVTHRRTPEWIMNMMLNPEIMVKEDEQAKKLFAEFLTPMANQNLAREDAEAVLTYFRSLDSEQSQ